MSDLREVFSDPSYQVIPGDLHSTCHYISGNRPAY